MSVDKMTKKIVLTITCNDKHTLYVDGNNIFITFDDVWDENVATYFEGEGSQSLLELHKLQGFCKDCKKREPFSIEVEEE